MGNLRLLINFKHGKKVIGAAVAWCKRLNLSGAIIDVLLTYSLKFEQELGGRPLVHGPTISDVIADNEELGRAILATVDVQPADTSVASQATEISPNLKVRI